LAGITELERSALCSALVAHMPKWLTVLITILV